METKILKTGDGAPGEEEYRALGRLLAGGGLVAFPTETVYGIAAARSRPEALRRLVELKGRDAEKPLSVHLGDAGDLDATAAPLSRVAARLVDRLWPGPVTLVLPDREGGFTGYRLPDHDAARALLRGAGATVVATSANRSGEPPLVTGRSVVKEFAGRVDAILDGGPTRYTAPSSVVRVTGDGFEVLREGVLDRDAIAHAAALRVLFVCTGNLCRSPMAEGILKTEVARRLGVSPDDLLDRGIVIESAGTGSLAGEPATEPAQRAAARYGADLARHASRPITPTRLAWADRIYVAERRHADVILDFMPEAAERVRPILADGEDLPDPFRRPDRHYERAAARIHEAADRIAEEVLRETGG